MGRKLFFFAPLAIVGLALFIGLGGWIVQLLWNWLLPTLFGWPAVTFWQALGLLLLCRILFGRFGGHGAYRGKHMNPEDRERFRAKMRERFGFSRPTASEDTRG
ncbi:MAG: hypothetical protein WCQ64_02435 [Acidobacteriota bacterium]